MSDSDTFTMEIKGLQQLVKALKTRPPVIKIGVLGDGRNATIGAVHEFGSPTKNIPQRSFLRVPLADHLEKSLEKSGLLDKNALAKVVKDGNLLPWAQKVAVVAQGVVDDAFETSGGGTWPAWKDPDYHNEGGMLLVDTGSLRDSITTQVEGGE